jgi:hypothetical protein
MHPFRAAVEARDFTAISSLLADDVVFYSPVAFKPYRGREIVSAILRGVDRLFGDLTYVRELRDEEGLALIFETSIGDVAVNGVDFLKLDGEGRITELKVMVRPLSASQAVAAGMAAQFETIMAEAAGDPGR